METALSSLSQEMEALMNIFHYTDLFSMMVKIQFFSRMNDDIPSEKDYRETLFLFINTCGV